MLQADTPADFVLATGVGATVGQFVEACFAAGGLDHVGHIEIDPEYYRPSEVDYLLGNSTKAADVLGWKATTHWDELARLMVRADIELLNDQPSGKGFRAGR